MSTEMLQFLIVEDDEDDFVHVRKLLRSSVGEAEVERAATASAAMAMANDHPHDLCFVDYRLGDEDGLDVLRGLKNIDAAAPVIFLTGQGDEEVAVQAMKAGATDYLLKSKLNAQSLETAVRYALTLGREQEAVRVARRALGASEQRFRALVENSSDAITLLDAQGTIIYTSIPASPRAGYWATHRKSWCKPACLTTSTPKMKPARGKCSCCSCRRPEFRFGWSTGPGTRTTNGGSWKRSG